MKTEDLHQPIWLLSDDLKRKDPITYMHYIQTATKLGVKEKSLVGCYLIDGTNRVYKIIDLIDLGNYNTKWKFEFFNPLRKIDLVLEEVSDSEVLRRITERMNTIKFKELLFEKNEKTETRISSIVSYIIKEYSPSAIYLSSIDATGKLGGELTRQLNVIDKLQVPNDLLINILNEDGQVFEGIIELIVEKEIKEITIKIQDGICVDIYEKNLVLPDEIIGNYRLYSE